MANAMRHVLLVGLVLCLCGQARAADLDAAAVNEAKFSAKAASGDHMTPSIVKLQVWLDRSRFSPGEIDGKFGENVKKALRAFAEAKQIPVQKELSPEIWERLAADTQPVLVEYTIAERDVKGPFLARLPAKMEEMKSLKALDYTSAREALAEKFHMSEALLSALNPQKRFEAGTTIWVAATAASQLPPVAKIEVDKNRQTVTAFGKSGELIAIYPATVGSEEKPTPSGSFKVRSVTRNPTYRYNPDYKFKGVRSKTAFTINPGPNNPVGTVWIGLSAEGYGIHGTPSPDKISKTESHGCVRLTNWDAEQLAKAVSKETAVVFVEGQG